MKMLNRTMNSRYDENRTRSANDPVIRAGVMIANLSWNIAKISSGTVGESSGMGGLADAVEHEVGQRVADQPPAIVAEGQAEPDDDPEDRDHPQATKLWSIVETTFLKPTMPP